MTKRTTEQTIIAIQRRYVNNFKNIKRKYVRTIRGEKIIVHPGVFPPYLDSLLFIDQIAIQSTDYVLDACAGSGIIGIFAAQKAKAVVATDINPQAVTNIEENIRYHALSQKMKAVEANVFPDNSPALFDLILMNPPFTDHKAATMEERSVWDENNDCVRTFFQQLDQNLAPEGSAYVSWADFAPRHLVETLSAEAGFQCKPVVAYRDERNSFTLYKINRV